MPRITRQPSDETADTGLQSTDGTFNDDAAGGFPAVSGHGVMVTYTYSLAVDADSAVGTASTVARIQYQKDGGSWTNLRSISVSSINGVPASPSDSDADTRTGSIGAVVDLSTLSLRAEVDLSFTGDGSGTARAQLTGWEISYHAASGVLEA